MLIIPQTLNINNSRTTKAKPINLHTIRKLIEYSIKKVHIKAMFTPTVFEILISEDLKRVKGQRVKRGEIITFSHLNYTIFNDNFKDYFVREKVNKIASKAKHFNICALESN